MTITNERLRELAAYSSDPRANLHHHLAAELLAAREQLACKGCGGSVGDHLTPDQGGCPARFEIDGIHMVPAALLDAAAGRAAAMAAEVRRLERANVVDRDNATAWEAMANARLKERDAARAELAALHARIEHSHNGYQDTGKAIGMDRPVSHLIALGELLTEQVEMADSVVRIERDEARAEAKRYHDALVARHGGEPVALLEELDEARAECERLKDENDDIRRVNGAMCICKEALDKEVARVAKQRDELIRAKTGNNPDDYFCCSGMECGCHGVTVREYELHYVDRAIAAEQPKPACHLCNLPMPDGTDGHGLGECVPVCPTCDGSGTAEQPKPEGEGGAS